MRQSSWLIRGLILLILALVLGLAPTHTASASESPFPTANPASRYIVVFEHSVDVNALAGELGAQFGLQVTLSYQHALSGIAAAIPDWAVPLVESHPLVKYVAKDSVINIHEQIVPTGVQRVYAPANPVLAVNGRDDVRVDADVAIIDTGIDLDHPDLNVANGVDCTQGWLAGVCVPGGDDDHFHGTHIAGTIGALDNGEGTVGVAPGVRLWAVKALDSQGEGTTSWLVAAIDYVAQHADEIEVANMSLGCVDCSNPAQDEAIANAVAAGVTFVVSGGNEGHDASRNSPANHPDVITVSAMTDYDGLPGGLASPTCYEEQDDTFAGFSNYGTTIDIAAPGVCITSTYPLERGGIGTISGTSMAAPHVAGAAALLAASGDYAPAQIRQMLIENGSYDWTDDSGDGVQEPLLDVSNPTVFAPRVVPGSQAGDTTPLVNITSPANGATVSGVVGIAAEATDDDGVAQVEFFVDDASIGADADGSDGWSVDWDSTTVPDGPHTIRAVATDTTGESSEASIGVIVANSTASDSPPSVSLTSPPDGATVSGTVTVTADAADDQGVAQVEFFVDGVGIGADADGSDGWSVEWDTTTTANASHILSAVATDTAGQTAEARVSVTVNNDATDQPPQVRITSPADGETVGGTVRVVAETADDGGVRQVEFFAGSLNLGADTDGSDGWAVDWDTTAVEDGQHRISAVATDTAGQTTSTSVLVTVSNGSDDEDGGGLTLSASRSDVWVWSWVELSWSGAEGDLVMIWRNGLPFRPAGNDGSTIDYLPPHSGPFTYRVCEMTGGRCSNEVTAAPQVAGG